MRKSIIAAAFATVLPASAMAQDAETPSQTILDVMCTQVSLSEQFCVALENGQPPVVILETPDGQILGMPGMKIDEEGNAEPCMGIVDRQLNLRGLVCQGNEQPQENGSPEQPGFIAPN